MDILFDLLILICLVMTAIPAVIFLHHALHSQSSWEHRHKKLITIFSFLLLFGFILIIYGSFLEPHMLYVRQEKIDLPQIDKPIKIALIADIQVGPYKKTNYAKRISEKLNSLQTDLILMAGDNVNNSGNLDEDIKYLDGFRYLNTSTPIFAINGNHEYGVSDGASLFDDKYRLPNLALATEDKMKSLGINFLVNQLVTLDINGQKFNLFGGDSYWAQNLDLKELRERDNDLPTIALIHNPSAFYDVAGNDVDLMLSGHTHGGQVRLPFLGPLIKVSPDLPRSWHKGWVTYNDTKMFVTSGLGETGVRSRLFNWPEIIILTIY